MNNPQLTLDFKPVNKLLCAPFKLVERRTVYVIKNKRGQTICSFAKSYPFGYMTFGMSDEDKRSVEQKVNAKNAEVREIAESVLAMMNGGKIVTGDSIAVRSNCTHTWPGKRAGMTCSECIDKPKPAEVVRVYDDRGRIIGWKCEGCKRTASYLSQLRHLEGCNHIVERD